MPLTLVETPGAANANTYATLAELNAYVDARVPAVSLGTDEQKKAMLITAARFLDACFDWTGAPVDGTQALTWPRSGMFTRNGFAIPTTGASSIPADLKAAQCEYAVQISTNDFFADNEAFRKGVSSVSAGSVSVSFQSVNWSDPKSVDIALRRLGSELLYVSDAVPQAIRMLLVPSWYEQPTIVRPLMFRAV